MGLSRVIVVIDRRLSGLILTQPGTNYNCHLSLHPALLGDRDFSNLFHRISRSYGIRLPVADRSIFERFAPWR